MLTESEKELEKETAPRPGEFPSTPKKKGEPAPHPNPDSSSSETDSDNNNNMSEAGPADLPAAPPPEPVPHRMTRLAAKLHQPPTFSGEGDDFKEETFETWYTTVRLYLNVTGVTANAPGSGNYWILYTRK